MLRNVPCWGSAEPAIPGLHGCRRAFRPVGTSFVLQATGSERHPCLGGEKSEVQGCAGGSSVPWSCRRCWCGGMMGDVGRLQESDAPFPTKLPAIIARLLVWSCVWDLQQSLLLLPQLVQTKPLKLTLPGAAAFLELSLKKSCHSRKPWIYAHVTGCLLPVSNSSKTPGQGCEPRPPTLDFVVRMTQERQAGAEEFHWTGMLWTQQHAEIPSSDECIRKRADKPILLHNPVVAD